MPKVFLETSETLFYDSGINIYCALINDINRKHSFYKSISLFEKEKGSSKMPKVFLETSETPFYDSGINIYCTLINDITRKHSFHKSISLFEKEKGSSKMPKVFLEQTSIILGSSKGVVIIIC